MTIILAVTNKDGLVKIVTSSRILALVRLVGELLTLTSAEHTLLVSEIRAQYEKAAVGENVHIRENITMMVCE